MTSSINKSEPFRIGVDGMVTPTLRTGIGRYLENILLALNGTAENIEYTVYLGSNQKDLSYLLPKHFLMKQSRISTEQSVLNFLRLQFVLPHMCRKHKADVLHIPNEKLLFFKSCPLVITIHDVSDFRVPKRNGFARRIYRRLTMPLMLGLADHIITVSDVLTPNYVPTLIRELLDCQLLRQWLAVSRLLSPTQDFSQRWLEMQA